MDRSAVLLGVGIGAGLMYGLDPQQGNRRRALARARLSKVAHRTGHMVSASSRDVAHRATGLAASLHSRFFERDAPDEVVEARVRARLGRITSHPGAIRVSVRTGVATLVGPALRHELADIVRGVSSVRGVTRVEDRLEPHEMSDHVPQLHAHAARRVEHGHRDRLPTTTLLAGAALAAAGLWRHGKVGMLVGAAGFALLARAMTGGAGLGPGVSRARVTRAEFTGSADGVSIPIKFGPRPGQPHRPGSSGPVSDRVH